jgi:hypothetical protein
MPHVVRVFLLFVLMSGLASAAAVPPVADFPLTTSGFVNGSKFQIWTNGVATPTFGTAPSPAITGLGAPALSGILAATSVPAVTSYIDIVNGSATWSVPNGGQTSNISVQWDGYFLASAAGTYGFTTRSSDGSALFIGSTQVVANNFVQTATSRTGLVALDVGFHAITVIFGKGTGGYDMTVTSSFNGGAPVDINTNLFLRLLNAPTISPPGGATGLPALNVSMSVPGSPAGTVIYYTTDGSEPTMSSLVYPGAPVTASVPNTVKAIATAPGFDGSLTRSVSYTCLGGVCASPTATATSTPMPTTTFSSTSTATQIVTPTPTTLTTAPTPSATNTPGPEICDNCIDDDRNGSIDRNDAACTLPDGGGAGVGDATRGKKLVKCALAIQKTGATFERKRLARLQKCVDAILACVEVKNADPTCLTKAQATCDKAIAAFPADDAGLSAKIVKSCGPPVAPADLTDIAGLGYGTQGPTSVCMLADAPVPTDAASVAGCVAKVHVCRAALALGIEVPRAAGLLTLVNHAANEIPCLPAAQVGAATSLGDGKIGKLAVKCEAAIKKAGAELIVAELKGIQKCVNPVFVCTQVQPNAECMLKAQAGCDKAFSQLADQSKGLGGKLLATVLTACQISGLALSDVLDSNGLGVRSLESECTLAGVPGVHNGITNLGLCLATYHKCRAGQLLEAEIPRLKELLLLGGHAALP